MHIYTFPIAILDIDILGNIKAITISYDMSLLSLYIIKYFEIKLLNTYFNLYILHFL